MERNPHFRSSGDRPSGFVDRIEVRISSERRLEPSIRAVQTGAADLTIVANPFVSLVGSDRLAALSASAPGRVVSDPAPTTDWMFLNTTRAPFDDLRVRQALNLATDRAALVALAGGAEVSAPTCQIVPRASPGYAPYCPYTAQPAKGGGWTAPDVERARRLVAESGAAGQRVVVHVPVERRGFGRYFVRLLRDLGFRAGLHVRGDDYFSSIYAPDSRAQIGFVGWGGDYISPSTFVEPNFGCSASGPNAENASRLCDGALAAATRRARALPDAEAAGAWAAADRRVIELALVVPMTNRRTVMLVSKRVGNVQTHAQWFALLDQMWVR